MIRRHTCGFLFIFEWMKHMTFENVHFTSAVMGHKFSVLCTLTNRHLRAKSVTWVIKATANTIRQFFCVSVWLTCSFYVPAWQNLYEECLRCAYRHTVHPKFRPLVNECTFTQHEARWTESKWCIFQSSSTIRMASVLTRKIKDRESIHPASILVIKKKDISQWSFGSWECWQCYAEHRFHGSLSSSFKLFHHVQGAKPTNQFWESEFLISNHKFCSNAIVAAEKSVILTEMIISERFGGILRR